jgi:hypothetical protein
LTEEVRENSGFDRFFVGESCRPFDIEFFRYLNWRGSSGVGKESVLVSG